MSQRPIHDNDDDHDGHSSNGFLTPSYSFPRLRDKTTLKDHMRKKMHRRIRGSNREYDKFYLINYLELGKSWNDIQVSQARDEVLSARWNGE